MSHNERRNDFGSCFEIYWLEIIPDIMYYSGFIYITYVVSLSTAECRHQQVVAILFIHEKEKSERKINMKLLF